MINKDLYEEIKNAQKEVSCHYLQVFHSTLFSRYKPVVHRIRAFDVKDADRNYIARIILSYKYQAIVIELIDFVKLFSKNQDALLFENECSSSIDRIVRMYESYILKAFCEKFGQKYGTLIYNLVYESTFKTYHDAQISFIFKNMELVGSCEWQELHYKVSWFVTSCEAAFRIAFFHLEKVMKDLNGQLTNLMGKAIDLNSD